MSVAAEDYPALDMRQKGLEVVRMLVLGRLSCEKGLGRAEALRDVGSLVSHRLSPAEIRDVGDRVLGDLIAQGLLTDTRGRLALTPSGQAVALQRVGARKPPQDWGEIKDVHLAAMALGLVRPEPRHLKALSRPDGLRSAIVASAYDLKMTPGASQAKVRAALAVSALERAFGNKIKASADAGAGMSSRMSRMLAAQFLRKPREMGTDGRLLAALAAESVGATRPTIDAIRAALLREWIGRLIATESAGPDGTPACVPRPELAAPPAIPAGGTGSLVRPAAANRPDLDGFVREVHRAAAAHAEGWPGNRKTYISHVWREIAARYPEWGLSEVEFKGMLAEAHRTGQLVLVNSDLRDKARLAELNASAITYKNTVWHFVRLPD